MALTGEYDGPRQKRGWRYLFTSSNIVLKLSGGVFYWYDFLFSDVLKDRIRDLDYYRATFGLDGCTDEEVKKFYEWLQSKICTKRQNFIYRKKYMNEYFPAKDGRGPTMGPDTSKMYDWMTAEIKF